MALSTIGTALMYARYTKTTDVAIDPSKTYYIKKEGLYTKVEKPVVEELANYFERGAWQKLICIKDYPDLGGTPEQIEATTLCDKEQTFVDGVKQASEFQFTCNYSKEEYAMIDAFKDEVMSFALWFGAGENDQPDGHDGKFEYQGTIAIYIAGKGVNEVREMIITTTKKTDVKQILD